jgi:5-methylcytosine-specific restriction endonuclease McrA
MISCPKRKRIKLTPAQYNKLVAEVLERDGYTCQYCGRWTEERPHHIIFRSLGGDDSMENLITLCMACHRAVHDGKIKIDNKIKGV